MSRAYLPISLVILWGVAGCAYLPARDFNPVPGGPRAQNLSRFNHVQETGDFLSADRFAIYYQSLNEPLRQDEVITLTQYYLLRCKYRSAFASMGKIQDSQVRALFEAVLYSWLGAERKVVATSTRSLQRKGSELSATDPTISYSLDSKEIWADEWANLRYTKSPSCTPSSDRLAAEKKIELRQKAQNRFKSLPEPLLQKNSDLAVLAHTSGYAFSRSMRDFLDPGHPALATLVGTPISHNGSPQKFDIQGAKKISEDEFDLTTLRFESKPVSAQILKMPYVVSSIKELGDRTP